MKTQNLITPAFRTALVMVAIATTALLSACADEPSPTDKGDP